MAENRQPGPLEREIHALTRVDTDNLPNPVETEKLLVLVMQNVEGLNNAVDRLAAEIDRMRERASGTA